MNVAQSPAGMNVAGIGPMSLTCSIDIVGKLLIVLAIYGLATLGGMRVISPRMVLATNSCS